MRCEGGGMGKERRGMKDKGEGVREEGRWVGYLEGEVTDEGGGMREVG